MQNNVQQKSVQKKSIRKNPSICICRYGSEAVASCPSAKYHKCSCDSNLQECKSFHHRCFCYLNILTNDFDDQEEFKPICRKHDCLCEIGLHNKCKSKVHIINDDDDDQDTTMPFVVGEDFFISQVNYQVSQNDQEVFVANQEHSVSNFEFDSWQ